MTHTEISDIYNTLAHRMNKPIIRYLVKERRKAQRDLEKAVTIEDLRRCQGRLETLTGLVNLKKSLRKKLERQAG